MRALVVVESMFGNTRAVADAIAEGLGGADVVDVRDAPEVIPEDVGLVVVGGPTHAFGMTRPGTRADAVRQGGTPEELGIREFVERLVAAQDIRFAVFDTRVDKVRHLPGSAARGAGKALRKRGYDLVAKPESFYVADTPGPLLEGEDARARAWGRGLAADAS